MADDYQITLKGKIKILYQLEKLQDVVKLAEQYNEKYGKDVEIDMMRFKSERRLNKIVPLEENKAQITTPKNQIQKNSELLNVPEIGVEEEPFLLLPADHKAVQKQSIPVIKETTAAPQPLLVEKKSDDEPFPEANELIITDPFAEDKPVFSQAPDEPSVGANELIITEPFAEDKAVFGQAPDEPSVGANELIITEPFAEDKPVFSQAPDEPPVGANELIITDPFVENEPVFRLASNEPPVILIDNGQTEDDKILTEPLVEEMAIVEESLSEIVDTKIAFDFKSNPAIEFNVEPTLSSTPQVESMAANSAVVGESAEAWDKTSVSADKEKAPESKVEPAAFQINEQQKMSANESETETTTEKPQPVSEHYNDLLKKTKPSQKNAFSIKYLLVLILPLAAAVILWLALSGKLNFEGGGAEKIIPITTVKHPLPAVQVPAKKVPPVALIPQIDEKEKLVNEKIMQANNFLKSNDILNALAVVLEAKKIKTTEPLRLLEEMITKKIQEDETRAEEQKQNVQNVVQSEDQAYTSAETENTLVAWQNFLMLYPRGELTIQARNKIVVLQKKAEQKAEEELQLKIQRLQKLKLRSEYINLNQSELNIVLQQLGKLPVQFEQMEHGGGKVIIDYSTGLMWTLWNKPMIFSKAQWWANRLYARYSGWRLPTVEESLSLLQMDTARYSGLVDFAIWTGDEVSDQVRNIWVLKLPEGKFITAENDQAFYVWAVRKIIK